MWTLEVLIVHVRSLLPKGPRWRDSIEKEMPKEPQASFSINQEMWVSLQMTAAPLCLQNHPRGHWVKQWGAVPPNPAQIADSWIKWIVQFQATNIWVGLLHGTVKSEHQLIHSLKYWTAVIRQSGKKERSLRMYSNSLKLRTFSNRLILSFQ